MSNVYTFTPRRSVPAPASAALPSRAEMRARVEAAAMAALDTVERLIALLDQIDGDTDEEDGTDEAPALTAPETLASQVIRLRGPSSDRGQGLPEQG